jgi:hypothetical protein
MDTWGEKKVAIAKKIALGCLILIALAGIIGMLVWMFNSTDRGGTKGITDHLAAERFIKIGMTLEEVTALHSEGLEMPLSLNFKEHTDESWDIDIPLKNNDTLSLTVVDVGPDNSYFAYIYFPTHRGGRATDRGYWPTFVFFNIEYKTKIQIFRQEGEIIKVISVVRMSCEETVAAVSAGKQHSDDPQQLRICKS